MGRLTMTIRNLLFIVLGALSALLILVAGMSARDAWTERQVANEGKYFQFASCVK